MSKSDADLKRRSQALSTNNRGFISRARFGEVRENLHDEDDEDIRLETYRTGAKVNAYKAIAKKESRGQKIIEILEESPNGYEITGKAPPEKDRAIKYYSFQLRQYTVIRFPEEYGLIHYSLGKVFFADRPEKQVNYDMRAKSIENALHHFRLAAETFDYDSHPFLFGTINIFIGQLFRERATLISSRSLLAKRGVTVSDCCAIALSQLMEAQSCFLGSRLHDIEYCLANLETAWVYVLQLTEAIYEEGRSVEENEMVLLREQAIIAIDRAKSLVDDYPVKPDNEKPRTWDPLDQTTHPEHIRLLIMNQGISYIGGLISYLTGRLHQEWNEDLEHQEEAFNNYCRAVKPGRLPMETETWVDAHHRAAALAIKYPKVVDTSFGDSMETDSDLCYVSSVKHLEAALKSSAMMPARKMDILFHLAQAQIARLHMITDRVPEGQSLIKALAKSEGITIMKAVESSLVEAMKGSTAANTQSTQDAFIYYFSCLKLSEFRMLQAAAEANLQPESREALLEDSIGQLVNALLSRSIIDNLDLHYVGTAQMAGMLMSSKRDNSAAKWFGKTLMCASAIGNRVQGSPVDLRQNIQGKFWEESCKQHSNAMLAASRHAKWVKTHLGPILLTESPTSGYAYWSMEMNLDPNEIPIIEEKEVIPLTYAQIKANRAPPSALQPHLSDREKEQLAEKTMLKGRTYADKMLEDSGVASLTTVQNSKSEPSAPMGAVPLWAMGQHPDFDGHDNRHETERKKISDKAQAIATAEANAEAKAKKAKNAMFGGILKLFGGSGNNGTANIDEEGLDNGLSPYIGRRRHLVPNMYVMINEVHDILATSAENAIFLMPNKLSNRVQFKVIGDDISSWVKRNEEKEKANRSTSILGSFISLFRKGPRVIKQLEPMKKAEELFNPEHIETPQVNLWCTTQCYFMFNSISRLQRIQLILRSNNLRLSKSERVSAILNNLPVSVKNDYYKYIKNMETASKSTAIPPITLRELSQRSFSDLQHVFQSHVSIARITTELEVFLFNVLNRLDYYVPMITCCPALTRDIGAFDKSLLNANILVCNCNDDKLQQNNKDLSVLQAKYKEQEIKAIADSKAGGTKKKKKILREADNSIMTKKIKNPAELRNELEELEKLRYGLAQKLDGSSYTGGSKEMIATYLQDNECMLLWHHPNNPSKTHKVQVVLIWREESKGKRKAYGEEMTQAEKDKAKADKKRFDAAAAAAAAEDKKGGKKKGGTANTGPIYRKGIVMECCKSEIDGHKLGLLIKNYLDAIHSFPASTRTSFATKALRTLSCHLALSELMLMIPKFIDSLIIVCPPLLRTIPWHLLLVEYQNTHIDARIDLSAKDIVAKGKVTEATKAFQYDTNLLDPDVRHKMKNPTIEEHLMERYFVRMAPSLPIYELCEIAASRFSNDIGLHKMQCIDGESLLLKSPGLRNASVETNCVKSIFSGDPDDCRTMQYDLASPKQFTTSKYYHVSKAEREKHKLAKELKKIAKKNAKEKKTALRLKSKTKRGSKGRQESSSSEDDSVSASEESDVSSEDEDAVINRRWLNGARVVHMAANRVSMLGENSTGAIGSERSSIPKDKQQQTNVTKFAAVALPQYFNSQGNATSDTRTQLNSADLVSQVHLTNCALFTLSRFGLADGTKAASEGRAPMPSPIGQPQNPYCSLKVMDANVEFIEACHLAGATTVMYPIWNGYDQGGLSTLASLVFMIRFYSELPVHSQRRNSIQVAMRNTQLWMRDQTANQIIAWLAKCPLPEKERLEMIKELEIYIDVSGPSRPDKHIYETVDVHASRAPVRPGDRKFFSHFLQWGSYCVSGQGGGVHPKDLTEEDEDVQNEHLIYDKSLNNISMEIMLLHQEGRHEEAAVLEQRRRELGIEALVEQAQKVKHLSILAARAMNDTLDALDKALLDQDDDEVSVGDEEEDELRRQQEKAKHAAEMDRISGIVKSSDRDIEEKRIRKEEEKAERKARKEAAAKKNKKYKREVGPLISGGGSAFLSKLSETNPQIAKLAKQQTPVSKFRGYIESLFPTDDDDDYEYDSEAAPGSPQIKKIKPRKFVPIEPGSVKMKELEKSNTRKVYPEDGNDDGDDEGHKDERDLYYGEDINDKNINEYEQRVGTGQRQRKFRHEKTPVELEAEVRALERKNEFEFSMQGSSANVLALLPKDNDNRCLLS